MGDLATVIHVDDEQENYHGQALLSRYLTTETWRRDDGEWKLYLIHAYAVPKDPPAITLPAKEMEQYVGRYVAGDLVYLIKWDGQQLVGGRKGGSMKPLQVEVRDVLFVPGLRFAHSQDLSARRPRQDHRIRRSAGKLGPGLEEKKNPEQRPLRVAIPF